MDEIRCDEQSYLIWKWHPTGTELGESKRENAIRWGSSLRVKDGSVAVFVYKYNGENVQEYIEGPFDKTLSTENLPIISRLVGLAYGGGTPFPAEVYFINLAEIIQIKFAVPFFDMYDPRFLDFGVPVAVRGTLTFKITDYCEFIELHRLDHFSMLEFHNQVRDTVVRYVKAEVAGAPAKYNIPVVQIESRIGQINDAVEAVLKKRLQETFGVTVSGVDISVIEIDKMSQGYLQLKRITQDVTTATIQTQTDVNLKDMRDKQRINAENYEESLRIQREESQYAQHMQTQSVNLAAYQTEKQAEVGVAGANAFGQMNANGAGNVDLGGGAGFNPMSMMAGMTMAGVMGQNLAGTMNNMMSGMNQGTQTSPPPVPGAMYHVVVNGQAAGPFNMVALRQMVSSGQLVANSLVWTTGMAEWAQAGKVEELKGMFVAPPPVPPQ